MTGILLPDPTIRAFNAAGAVIPGARLQFYISGTTTPTPAYSTTALAVQLANPVVADAGGLFIPIFLDSSVTYRVQLLDQNGGLIRDVDPVNTPIVNAANSITSVMLAGGVAAANLGFTPVSKAGDTATNLGLAFTAPAANSAGYLGAPPNYQNGNYTFALSDCGGMVRGVPTGAVTWTIPLQATVPWPAGTIILLRNAGANIITIQRSSGVTLYPAGAATNKDCSLAANGLATLIHDYMNDSWVISGVGVS